MKDIYDIVGEAQKRLGQPLALATLVHAEGSSYRRPGARMLICEDGWTVGSVSGGCIEEEIAARARSVLESGEPLTIDFDTRRRFGCHGRIDIFLERVADGFFTQIANDLRTRRSCLVVTTPNGSQVRPYTAGEAVRVPKTSDMEANPAFAPRPRDYGAAGTFPHSPFMQVVHPPLRLLLCGEGPDTIPLKELGSVLGWEPVLIADIQKVEFEADDWTAAIVKSHNFGRDFAMLAKLLPLNLRYVGLIGPKKRRDQLLSDLLEIGVSINAGFFAPAGLDLNAETPEEIALSVVSEIQRVFADASGQSLRDRKLPIHRKVMESASEIGWQTSAR